MTATCTFIVDNLWWTVACFGCFLFGCMTGLIIAVLTIIGTTSGENTS